MEIEPELIAANDRIEVVRLDDNHTGVEVMSEDGTINTRIILHQDEVLFLVGALIQRMNDHMVAVEICVDCMENTEEVSENPSEWLGFLDEWDGFFFVAARDDDGERAESHFAKRPCEGCGSHLHGERFRYFAVRDLE